MAVQVAALPAAKWILTTAVSGLLGRREGRPLGNNRLFDPILIPIARAANAANPIPGAQAAPVSGPKVSSTRRPPPGQEPLLNPPTEYRPPPSSPDWNPPPLYPGATPPISPVGGGPPNIGVLLDPQTWLSSAWWTNEYLASVFATATRAPQANIPKGPTGRAPAGRGDPFGAEAQAAMRRAEAAQEREIRREERAEERAQVRAEREAERRQAEYERNAGERRRDEAMRGLEWNPYITPGRVMDPRPRQTIGESEAVLAAPPARPAGNPWATYARAALPFLPLLSSLTQPGKGRSRRRDPLTQPQPEESFGPSTSLTSFYSTGVSSAFGPPPGTVGTNTCECKAPRPKRRKRKRTVCYSGTYTERADGTRKTKKRKVPCK